MDYEIHIVTESQSVIQQLIPIVVSAVSVLCRFMVLHTKTSSFISCLRSGGLIVPLLRFKPVG